MNKIELIKECRRIVKCDTARISNPLNKRMFFIIGFNRSTKNDEGQWLKNGELIDFDYINESVIASGCTDKELIESVKEYKRLCDISWEEYFEEISN